MIVDICQLRTLTLKTHVNFFYVQSSSKQKTFTYSQLVIWFTFNFISHISFNGFKRQQLLKTLCPPFLSHWHLMFFSSTNRQMVLSHISAGCWWCTLMGVVHLITERASFSFCVSDKRCLLGFICV